MALSIEFLLNSFSADQEAVHHDFLLLETLLYDLLNIFTRPVENVQINEPFAKDVKSMEGNDIEITTLISEGAVNTLAISKTNFSSILE